MAAQIREVEQSRQEMVRSVLEVGFPRRSQSSIQIHWFLVLPGPAFQPTSSSDEKFMDSICLSWIPFPAHQGAGLISGENVGMAGREGGCQMGQYPQFVYLWRWGAWPRQILKHSRHIYFSWIKLSLRQCQTQKRALQHLEAGKGQTGKRLLGNLLLDILIPLRTFCNCDQDMETNLILAVLMAKGPCLPAWLRFVFFSQVASTSQQPSYLDLPPAPELDWMETGQPLTFIGHQVQWERANTPSVPGHPSPLAFFLFTPSHPSPGFSVYSNHSCVCRLFPLAALFHSIMCSFLSLHGIHTTPTVT